MDVTRDIERRPTTSETRVVYDNSTWHAIYTTYINSTKDAMNTTYINSTKDVVFIACQVKLS